MVAGGALFAWYAYDLPDFDELYIVERRSSVTLKAADGMVLATYGDLYGEHQALKDLPPHLPQALIATEDRRFYSHFGIDPIGLARATLANLRAGRVVQGGSTLTQQLAKNVFLERDRTLKRKVQELMLAFRLEQRFTKDQILEMYLNRVYFGAGAYGVEAAAQRYFDKPATKLSLGESAMLVGLLKAPSKLAPTGNIKSAQARAAQVLRNMADAGFITIETAEAAIAKPTQLARSRLPLPNARYFADWVIEEVYQLVGRDHADLTVYTTMDSRLQGGAERAVDSLMDRDAQKLDVGQAALVALAPDGAVRAMIGGRDYLDSPFNRATQARRQPGSAFKPIVFLTALEQGITPDDQYVDGPIEIGNWKPRNYDGQYHGTMPLREAAARSINTIAVQVSERVGRDKVIETARRLGITSDLKPHPSLALGSFEVGVLELTAAYAAFANGGYAVQPYGVIEVRDRNNAVLFRRDTGGAYAHMIAPEPLGELNELLRGVIATGTGRAAQIGRPAAGKTGTTSDYRDAWFVGYTPDLVTAVWVGNDDNSPTKKVSGSGLPSQIWRSFMTDALKGLPASELPQAPSQNFSLPSLWDRIMRQFGSAPATASPASVPPPPRTVIEPAAPPPATSQGEPQMIWQVGPQPVQR
ncbi:MAG: transglycosylase domain-containing protein [Ferrovibrio sp.]|uniref:transglycosylase domain-containing protein n=1 Tax=Ferrovibrio sp. TaxID=1917215 RepID=UPI00391B1032